MRKRLREIADVISAGFGERQVGAVKIVDEALARLARLNARWYLSTGYALRIIERGPRKAVFFEFLCHPIFRVTMLLRSDAERLGNRLVVHSNSFGNPRFRTRNPQHFRLLAQFRSEGRVMRRAALDRGDEVGHGGTVEREHMSVRSGRAAADYASNIDSPDLPRRWCQPVRHDRPCLIRDRTKDSFHIVAGFRICASEFFARGGRGFLSSIHAVFMRQSMIGYAVRIIVPSRFNVTSNI